MSPCPGESVTETEIRLGGARTVSREPPKASCPAAPIAPNAPGACWKKCVDGSPIQTGRRVSVIIWSALSKILRLEWLDDNQDDDSDHQQCRNFVDGTVESRRLVVSVLGEGAHSADE